HRRRRLPPHQLPTPPHRLRDPRRLAHGATGPASCTSHIRHPTSHIARPPTRLRPRPPHPLDHRHRLHGLQRNGPALPLRRRAHRSLRHHPLQRPSLPPHRRPHRRRQFRQTNRLPLLRPPRRPLPPP